MSDRFPQVRSEWRETQWSKEKRTRFATTILRLVADEDEKDRQKEVSDLHVIG